MDDKKETRGRKKGLPTETKSFRVDKASLEVVTNHYGKKVNFHVNQFIKKLAKSILKSKE